MEQSLKISLGQYQTAELMWLVSKAWETHNGAEEMWEEMMATNFPKEIKDNSYSGSSANSK